MLDKDQLREMIEVTLKYLDPEIPYSDTAVELLMLTAAHESRLGTYLKQLKGPARGIFQMEPATHNDLWENFLQHKSNLRHKIMQLTITGRGEHDNMTYNLMYQVAMARVHYFRIKYPLPPNVPSMLAAYWKKFYNTYLGKGTAERAERDYRVYVLGEEEE